MGFALAIRAWDIKPDWVIYRAYRDIYGIVTQMKMGEGSPFVGRLGEMFSFCTDGKRPVVFMLERLDESVIPI